jgi:radical SAM-linked protein
VSRADRRAADLLERAFELGCRFDAWREHLRFDLWQQAIRETGYDVVDALRERQVDERLPWDHIDVMIPKQWFVEDWARAKELQHAQDCRHKRCHKCGVIDVERELCASMLRGSIDGRKTEETWVRKPRAPWVEPTPTGRLWFRIGRTGPSRFLSHLEAMNAWMRTLRRGKVPVAYTQGFHPHARVAFTAATPQGEETVGDWMDVVLSAEVDPQAVLEKLRSSLPDGFELFGVKAMPMSAPSLMQLNEGGVYTMWIPGQTRESMAARIDEILAMTMIPVEREGKRRGQSTINLRPMIRSLRLHGEGEVPAVEVIVGSVDGKNAKPRELAALLSGAPETVRTLKRDTLWRRADGELLPYEKFDGTAVLAAAAEASDEVVDEAQA